MTWGQYQIGNFEFTARGESGEDADKGPVSTYHSAVGSEKINKSGTLLAAAPCNLHGSWENSKAIKVNNRAGQCSRRKVGVQLNTVTAIKK